MESAAVATWRMTRHLGSLPGLRVLKPTVKTLLVSAAFARAGCFIASYPKSGRTWLRFLLANYLNEVFELGLTVDFHSMFHIIPNATLDRAIGRQAYGFSDRRQLPFLAASHDVYQRSLFFGRKIIFMLRDPRDVLVSRYFHESKHYHEFAGSVKSFLKNQQFGAPDYIRYLNGWAAALPRHDHLIVTYEQLSGNPGAVVQTILRFLALEIDDAAVVRAVAAASFDAMRAAEIKDGLPTRDYDRGDENNLRVRRGKVGGFGNHLDTEDVAYVGECCRRELSDRARRLLAEANISFDAAATGLATATSAAAARR